MKRDDIISGIVGGTIIAVGCTVGIFGYQKMNEPIYAEPSVSISESKSIVSTEDAGESDTAEGKVDYLGYTSEDYPVQDDRNSPDPVDSIDSAEADPYVDKTVPEVSASIRSVDGTGYEADVSNEMGSSPNYFDTYDIPEQQNTSETYVLNTSTMKIHIPSCDDVKKINPENYATSSSSLEELKAQGYTACGHCFR
ncbi:MAG: hypothetical protein J5910_04145 [Lachnospiraceae bacterium]|nr:hypothetical protein [Lachnospiraceae bacterium]